MAIDNQFRIGELISSGSRAIVSKDEVSGNHTFTIGSKETVDTPYPHIKGERDGELTGRIEKPKYTEEELVKAVDTEVDELIGPPKKEKPPVVPKPLYDDLRRLYDERGVRINELESIILDLEAEVESLRAEVESLMIQMDALSLQTAAAQNEAQATNDRYISLLQDFSSAIVKSTKEGIERVSLKAQTEGLIAQKESLREQLKSLNLIVSNLQSQLSGAAAESSAAASGLVPTTSNETFYGFEQGQPVDDAWKAQDIGWTTMRDNGGKKDGSAGKVIIQNLRDENIPITQLKINVDKGNILGSVRPILGFGSGVSSTRTTNIEQGAKEQFDLYFNIQLGGTGDSKPKPRGSWQSARDYQGTFTIDIIYDDGFTETIDATWGLRKNRGS